MILVSFCALAQAQSEAASDKAIEARLHKIYVEHYSSPVLDSDWFKIVDAIDEQSYTVKSGDTLWGISKIYFGDGFYWSKLWSVNQNITNPHMISVNDTLNFKAGSFESAPSLSVEPSENEGAVEADTMAGDFSVEETLAAESAAEPSPALGLADPGPQANQIPDFFKITKEIRPITLGEVTVEKRPMIRSTSKIRLNRDILESKPNVVATVVAVGTDRINTGEMNKIVIRQKDREGGVNSGDVFSILDRDFDNSSEGVWIKALAVVRIGKQINPPDGLDFEADVIEQFDGLLVGSPVSKYQVKTVNLEVTGAAKELPIRVIGDKTKTFWANGDIIFLQSPKDPPNLGDIIRLNEKFDPSTDFFVQNSLIKVVSVSPPFSTGIVMDARTAILGNSKSF